MSLVPQAEWDAVRLEILGEAAEFGALAHEHQAVFDMLAALTCAFDRPVPVYSVYRKLNSFKAGQWPLIVNILRNLDLQSKEREGDVNAVLQRVAALLDAADKSRSELTEMLEIELDVLKTLIQGLD